MENTTNSTVIQTPISDILRDANNNVGTLKELCEVTSINHIFKYAFLKTYKMKLPVDVEYKASSFEDYNAPKTIRGEVKRFDVFINENVSEQRRVLLFREILENLTPREASILMHIKDQTLSELFPNINAETLSSASNDFVDIKPSLPDVPVFDAIEIKPPENVVETIVQNEISELYDDTPKGSVIERIKTNDSISFTIETNTEEPKAVKPKRTRKKKQ